MDLKRFQKRLPRSGRAAIEKEFESPRQNGAVNEKRSRPLPIHFVFCGGPEEIPGNACGVPVAWRLKKSSNLFGKPMQ